MTAPADHRESPLAAWAGRFLAASAEPVRFAIRELQFVAQIGVRCDTAHPGFASVLGCALPQRANTWASGRDCTVLWLGPDEWLVTADDARRNSLCEELRRALDGRHHAVVDLSASRAVVELSGADARGILAKGCTLDLRAGSFRPPQCAQTLLARTQMLLQATDDRPAFRIFVRPSFSPYLAEWLLDAAAETRASSGLDAGRIADRLAYTVHSPAKDA